MIGLNQHEPKVSATPLKPLTVETAIGGAPNYPTSHRHGRMKLVANTETLCAEVNLLEAALDYAAAGWPVFPCGANKRPLTPHGFKDATTDEMKVRQWWTRTPQALIGIPTGATTGIVVLDVDMPEGPGNLADLEGKYGTLPSTLEQQTRSGGRHIIFKHPGREIKNRASYKELGNKLDVRGDGGYIIAAPSPGYSSNGLDPVPLPGWLLTLLTKEKEQPLAPPPRLASLSYRGTPYGMAALEAESQALRATGEGTRNHRLNAAAFSLAQLVAGGELQREEVTESLMTVALQIGLDAKEAQATIRSGMVAGAKAPRQPERPGEKQAAERKVATLQIETASDCTSNATRQPPPDPADEPFSMAELLKKEFKPIQWAVPGLLPEGLAILSGPPKIGKSWLVMDLCLAVACGGYSLGHFKADQGEALLLSLEDNERRLKERLKTRTSADPSVTLHGFHAQTTWARLDNGGLARLEVWLKKHPACKLVVIDTIQKIKAKPAYKNGNAYENDYESYGALQRLALERQCCILVIHHNRKSDSKNETDPLEAISGSIGITGTMDTILMLKRPRGGSGAVLAVTGRDIADAQYGLTFDKVLRGWTISGPGPELGLKEGSNASRILEVMKDRPGHMMTVLEVFEALDEDIKYDTVKRELYRLVNKGLMNNMEGKFAIKDTVSPASPVTAHQGHSDTSDIRECMDGIRLHTHG